MSIDGYHVDVMSCKTWAYWTLLVGFLLSLGVGGEGCQNFEDYVELNLLKDHLFKFPIFQHPSEPPKTEYSALSIVNMLCSSWIENMDFHAKNMSDKTKPKDPRTRLMASYSYILRDFSRQSRQPVTDRNNASHIKNFCREYNCSLPYRTEYISVDEFKRIYNDTCENKQLPECPSKRGPSSPPSQASTTPSTSNGAPSSQVSHTTDPSTTHDPSTLLPTPRQQTINPSTPSHTPHQQTINPSTLSPTPHQQTINPSTLSPTPRQQTTNPSTLSPTPRQQTTSATTSFPVSNVTNSSEPDADNGNHDRITDLQLQSQIFTLLFVVSVLANIVLLITVWCQRRSRRQIYLQDRSAVPLSHETVQLVLLRSRDTALQDHPAVRPPRDSTQVVLLRSTELQGECDASGFLSYQAT